MSEKQNTVYHGLLCSCRLAHADRGPNNMMHVPITYVMLWLCPLRCSISLRLDYLIDQTGAPRSTSVSLPDCALAWIYLLSLKKNKTKTAAYFEYIWQLNSKMKASWRTIVPLSCHNWKFSLTNELDDSQRPLNTASEQSLILITK